MTTRADFADALQIEDDGSPHSEPATVEQSNYTKVGGRWLGAARIWIERNCHNGSTVIWGSETVLRPALTARHVEDLAARVADAANVDADEMKKRLDDLRTSKLESEIKLTNKIDRALVVIRDLVDQIKVGEYTEQEGHTLKMNTAYLKAVKFLEE